MEKTRAHINIHMLIAHTHGNLVLIPFSHYQPSFIFCLFSKAVIIKTYQTKPRVLEATPLPY